MAVGDNFLPPDYPRDDGEVLTDLHSFSETCPWPCSPAPDSILSSGGPALEEKHRWVSWELGTGQALGDAPLQGPVELVALINRGTFLFSQHLYGTY